MYSLFNLSVCISSELRMLHNLQVISYHALTMQQCVNIVKQQQGINTTTTLCINSVNTCTSATTIVCITYETAHYLRNYTVHQLHIYTVHQHCNKCYTSVATSSTVQTDSHRSPYTFHPSLHRHLTRKIRSALLLNNAVTAEVATGKQQCLFA